MHTDGHTLCQTMCKRMRLPPRSEGRARWPTPHDLEILASRSRDTDRAELFTLPKEANLAFNFHFMFSLLIGNMISRL